VSESPSLQIQVPSSEIIIIGTVKEMLPARWSTADGQRPPNPCGVTQPPFPYIYTPVRVTVEQVIKGSVSTSEIEVHELGGTVGQDRRFDYDRSPLVTGQRAVMFLNVRSGSSIATRYIINPDGSATEADSPHRNVPLQQLLAEITTAVGGSPPVATPPAPPAPTSAPESHLLLCSPTSYQSCANLS
jgi:hypothetical protein